MNEVILVTGGAGYIGSHTCLELLNNGYEVIVLDNLSNSSEESLKRVQLLAGKPLKFYFGDIRNKSILEKIFAENKIDCVMHFAGYKAVGESVGEPLKYYENNVSGSLILYKAILESSCKKIIFSSSATVYGIPEHLPLTEECRISAINPYGATKVFNERILLDLAAAHMDFNVILLRYFNPIGAHESGLIGEDPKGIPNNLMPYLSKVALGQLEKVYVYGGDYPTPDGTGVRDYIHVVDLARGHVAALKGYTIPGPHVCNLGTGRGYSVLEVIHAFEKVSKRKIPFEIIGRRSGDNAVCYASADRARKEIGWQASYDIEEMCRTAWNWQTKNPNGYEK